MKILTVTHFFESHGGGIERVAGHLCRQFAAVGHEPVWAAADGDALPETIRAIPLDCWNGVERVTGLPVPIPHFGALCKLRKAIAQADAVVVHDALYATSIIALIAARRARTPVLLVQHVADIPFSHVIPRATMRVANRLVTRPMLHAADQVVFISSTTREAFRSVAMRQPPLLLFNGVDHEVFHTSPGEDRQDTRHALGLPADRKLLLFVGRFVAKKGLSIIEALARRRPDLFIALAGRGPIDPERWGRANVKVLRGLTGTRLAALYRSADILLLPSVGEGYPLVIQEALACGLPVVCGRDSAQADPGAARWLTGVEVTLAQPEETAVRIAEAVDAYLGRTPPATEMAAYAAHTYSWPQMAAGITDALDRAAASHPR